MRLSLRHAVYACRRAGQHFGLAFMFLGIFLEKPAMFALSILALFVTTPLREVIRRGAKLRFELFVVSCLIAMQAAAASQFNALIVMIYLMGLLNGLLLPDPRTFHPKSWFLLVALCVVLAIFFTSSLPSALGLTASESAFGTNPEDYQIDPRSLTYGVFIVALYLSPHFTGLSSGLQTALLLLAAALGTNKFGMLYAGLYRLTPKLVLPLVVLIFVALAAVGLAQVEFTAARSALWRDFFLAFPSCVSQFGACTEVIIVNNEEGVRSFHSILLDFTWYGGYVGLLGGLFFVFRVAGARSNFGRSAGVLFAVALLFGFPPFFNERHVLIVYAFLVLFQKGNPRRVAHRPLRTNRPVPVQERGAAELPGR